MPIKFPLTLVWSKSQKVQSRPRLKGATKGRDGDLAVCLAASPGLHQGTGGIGLLPGDTITHL